VVRNEAVPESDVDVLVGFDLETHLGLFEFVVELEVGWMTNLPH
jgi:predicted nucleotidyltransferase